MIIDPHFVRMLDMRDTRDRRRWPRYTVTLSARINGTRRTYRGTILDVSKGGLLLSMPDVFPTEVGASLVIDAAMIGTVRARVVTISAHGIHVRVDDEAAADYDVTIRKLSRISQSW